MNAKRCLDVVVASTALLASAPLLGALALAVRIDTPGPALFQQVRVGMRRKPFKVIKLRTMTSSAAPGLAITAATDARITRMGRLLRRCKLDELPQLWNVLRGDMSLVGPRPEVPRYVERYRPEWQRLLEVRPGLTDLASLTFRDEEQLLASARNREQAYEDVIMPLKLELALRGVEGGSFASDLRTLAMTALAVVGWRPASARATVDAAMQQIAALNRRST